MKVGPVTIIVQEEHDTRTYTYHTYVRTSYIVTARTKKMRRKLQLVGTGITSVVNAIIVAVCCLTELAQPRRVMVRVHCCCCSSDVRLSDAGVRCVLQCVLQELL